MAGLLHRLGQFSVRRRRLVVVVWLLALALAVAASAAFAGSFKGGFSVPGTDSQRANDLIAEQIPGASADGGGRRRPASATPPSPRATPD